jgi:opacity protein-like surface antigen
MKKRIFTAMAVLGLLFGTSSSASAQVEEGSIMIDPYVGFPTHNMWWSQIVDLDGTTNYSTAGSPVSFGGRIEYMVADNFGLGIDGNYAISGFQYNEDRIDSLGVITNGEYKYTATRLRIMLRLNYHFVQTENLDVYAGFGAGYKRTTRKATWNGSDDGEASFSGSLLPIATRIALGGRYYFHPNIGLSWELGAGGGGILQAGLAVKI